MEEDKNEILPVPLKDLDLTKIKYGQLKVRKFKDGTETKACSMTWQNGEKIYVVTQDCKVPFGVSKGKDKGDKKEEEKYSLELNMVGDELKKLKDLDDLNIAYISSKSKEWYKEEFDPKTTKQLIYNSILKKGKEENSNYPERLRIKLPISRNEKDDKITKFSVYDKSGKDYVEPNTLLSEVDWSWSQLNMSARAVMELECLWEVNKKLYCTFKAIQICVTKPKELPKKMMISEEVEEVKDVIKEVKEVKSNKTVDEEENLEINDESSYDE
jgi:hypothetical protein